MTGLVRENGAPADQTLRPQAVGDGGPQFQSQAAKTDKPKPFQLTLSKFAQKPS